MNLNRSLEELPDSPPSSKPKRIIAIGGSGGGVGKSVFAVNTAIYFAQLGKRVVLAGADAASSHLHSLFGLTVRPQVVSPQECMGGLSSLLVNPASIPGLSILPPLANKTGSLLLWRASSRTRWLTSLLALPADYLVIYLGAGYTHFALDLLGQAHVPILLTSPEPSTVESIYVLLRAAYQRRLQRALVKDRYRMGLLDRAIKEKGLLPSPLELIRTLSRMDASAAELAWNEVQRMRFYLVVSQTRTRAEIELGAAMTDLVGRHYGVRLEELGHIEYDDLVWLTGRKGRPLLLDSPNCRAARNIERIARRVSVTITRRTEPLPLPISYAYESPSFYAMLGVAPSSTEEEMRRAYKQKRDIYASGSVAIWSFFAPEERRQAQLQLEEAYDTLIDPSRRRAYDLSLAAKMEEASSSALPASKKESSILTAERLMLQSELAQIMGPDTEFSGELLRKVRESRGIELEEISARTKITQAHLIAIEEEQIEKFPAFVYLQGFIGEFAKQLSLDPVQVQRTYLRRMRHKGLMPGDRIERRS
ncbi:helix-turn-helix domain-containing protein [Pajaroellobacter abortibovis]|uniref:J domain-containing protein n=1 Tax=Pajaroellobacter abortibovis TaxID=1882918 RepID=A0A1L6MUY5_9BACT|nr:helix-turn-helix domain-containing protein [Pajaroellobacter abortibovis]APR99328.1 hypothetical protein BCY86_00530 [Pajaroellobacter abortibovis]